MSKALSLKLQDSIFLQTEEVIKTAHIPRNTYINQAVDFYNRLQRKKSLREKLVSASKAVQIESMQALAEFESLNDLLPE